jgi:uncharacterized protein YraI
MRALPVFPSSLKLFCLAIACAAAAHAADFPYDAYISTDQTQIIAGPGHRYYATDRLTRGAKVEIYREDASGWLAIRPPEGSFSWVPAEFVERLEDENLGRVKESTGAWIGTSIEHVSEHQQQVTLKPGEVVQILSEKSLAARGTERTWLKIAPPAGEFRWVHLRDVSRQKPEEPKREELRPEDPNAQQVAAEPAPAAAAPVTTEEKPSRVDRLVEPAQFPTAIKGAESQSLSPDGFVPRKRRTDDQVTPVPFAPARPQVTSPSARPTFDAGTRIASATPARVAVPAGNLSSEEIARQLDQIEVDLSLMIAQDRSQWNLAGLKRRAESLVEGGADPASRGRARLVLDKIKQFDEAFDARSLSSQAPKTPAQSLPASTSSISDPRYDAQGWLKPVISRKSDKPAAPYAVVDSEGKPVCFISPSPGLNLNRYLNKQVGLYGRRGFLEELKKPHLMAERIVEIDSHLR